LLKLIIFWDFIKLFAKISDYDTGVVHSGIGHTGHFIMRFLIYYIFLSATLLFSQTGYDTLVVHLRNAEGEEKVNILNNLAELTISNDPAIALQYTLEAIHHSQKANYDEGEAFALANLGAYYYRINRYDSSLVYYQKADEYFRDNENYYKVADINYNIGKVYDSISDFENAKKYYSETYSTGVKISSEKYTGLGLLGLGAIERLEGFFESAFQKHLTAYEYLQKSDSELAVAEALKYLGMHYRDAGELTEALHFYRRSLLANQKLNNWRGEATALGFIGIVYKESSIFDSALYYHEKALKIREENNDLDGVGISLANIAQVYATTGDPETAAPYLENSIRIRKQTGNVYGLVLNEIEMAKISLSLGNLDEAEESLNEAYKIASKNNFRILLRDIYHLYTRLYEDKKEFEKALEYHSKYDAYNDSLSMAELSQKINSLKTKFETDKKIEELELVKRQEDLEYYILISLSILVVVMVVFSFGLYRKNKLYNHALGLIKIQNDQLESLNNELSEKNQSLTELNFTKDKFLSIIAHDLRNPFVTILGYTDLLKNDKDSDVEEKNFMIEQVDKSARRAFALLENLLQWGMSQTGNIKMNIEPQSLRFLILEAVSQVKVQAEKKEILIDYLDEVNIYVLADQYMILTVLRNLLTNAIKFTGKNGKITIWSEAKKNKAKINISDTGVGLSKNEITNLFVIGKGKEGTAREKGSGLGLVLCKEFIERNKGNMSVESEQGKGSVFSFTLPIVPEK